MRKKALNYTYLSEKHAGGKDQAGLNLLQGFQDLHVTDHFFVICFDYLEKYIREIAPDMEICILKSHLQMNELTRMFYLSYVNTVKIPALLKQKDAAAVFHLNCNNGLRKFKIPSVVIPYDIKAVAHRVLGKVKIPWYKYYLYRIMYRMDFSHADCIIAMSDFDKAEMVQYYPRYQKKIRRIYIPIRIEMKKAVKAKKPYITALNIQFHHKNTITLIRAFERVYQQIPHDLYLIGCVPERMRYLQEYIKEHPMGGRVHFTGFVTDEERDKLFLGSDLYVNPTLYEGFGMTAVEAIMQKVPTLVSNVASNYEVTMGLCSYYEPADSEEVLAAALLKCLLQKQSDEMLELYSKKMQTQYDYLRISREYLELFQDL